MLIHHLRTRWPWCIYIYLFPTNWVIFAPEPLPSAHDCTYHNINHAELEQPKSTKSTQSPSLAGEPDGGVLETRTLVVDLRLTSLKKGVQRLWAFRLSRDIYNGGLFIYALGYELSNPLDNPRLMIPKRLLTALLAWNIEIDMIRYKF